MAVPGPDLHDRRVPPMRRAIIWGNVTDDAIAFRHTIGGSWLNLVSADSGVWNRDRRQLEALFESGPVEVWCDCRVSDGTPPQKAIDLARELGVGWVGQAETAEELEWAVGITKDGSLMAPAGSERAKRLIANPNAWTAAQRDTAIRMIHAGDLSVSGEQYAGPAATAMYSSQGVPIDSITLGVAMDAGVYHHLSALVGELRKRPDSDKFLSTVCLWHGSGLQPEAWQAARAL